MTPHSWLYSPKTRTDNSGRKFTPEEMKKNPLYKQCQHCGMVAMQWTTDTTSKSFRLNDIAAAMYGGPSHPGVAPPGPVFEHCEEEEVWKIMMA